MSEIYKIVLTGGPCAGKTTALDFIKNELESRGVEVFVLNEIATYLMNNGLHPHEMGSYQFHSLLFKTQLDEEKRLETLAQTCGKEKAVILCDRGLLDNKVYVSDEDFKKYSASNGMNENKILCSYNAVFHLVTAANGAEEFYTLENNNARSENPEKARQLDEDIISVWAGTPHLRVIDNSTGFELKLKRLLSEVLAVVGIPQPLEIERKFLIVYPDLNFLNNMKLCRKIPISQTYLKTPDEGNFRIRKRGEGEQAVYIKTVKRKISDIKRIEIENYISEKEYNDYLMMKEFVNGTISKDRYCFVDNSTYYELDVFPFWNNTALLEIELLSEDQEYSLPEFVNVIREVTFEKQFRNKTLAVMYGEK